jgi:hypothetical protein
MTLGVTRTLREQPWSSVSCGIHAVDASQGLRESLGRDVGRGVAPDSA